MITELDMQRNMTQWFIAAKPSTLVLTPRKRVRHTDGSWVRQAENPRLPQIMRVIEQAEPAVIVQEDGTQRKATYVLLGLWDALVSVGDTFVYAGDPIEVVKLNTDNGYEQRAFCDRYIPAP